ncbi:UDP-glycosyltransferase 83A1-like isoform X2 [Cannabis sativa]|uniref:UDP-glycosyltransferase 83A1-like isoform X2 n=1 Tax=Cannabis sativa TaxID=3483 RepID=UPI0029CA224D|nr:UDP-glycosyltransferase 83A1-like isoform X2 [Cannabis sativa]
MIIQLAKKIIRMISTRKQRVMVVPCPAQGHVKPLVLFSHKLAQHGFRITFVYTDFDHNRISSAKKDDDDDDNNNNIEFVSIPDGLRPEDDRGCAMEVATKLGIKGAVFCPSSAALLVHARYIPNMVNQGIMDESDGTSIHKQIIQLSPNMPSINTEKFPWTIDGSTKQKRLFQVYFKACQASEIAEWCLCNTTYDIESSALSLNPKFLSIGPLMANQANNSSDIPGSQFWAEDSSCLNWLDQQKPCSVIYIAFGSLTIHDNTQILELARGLELIGKPFLWVVRPGFMSGDLGHEFDPIRILGNNNFGKLVSWAPQQKVLSHPSIACFVSHCGWNSTIEGLSNGVPFLCWPYFGDQFLDKAYICDVWKVGIELEPSESGIILSQEIEIKVNKLLGDEEIRKKSIQLKEMILKNIAKDGQSFKNLDKFIKWLEET